MASQPQHAIASPGSPSLPFLDYAQVVRMLVPPATKIGFYDRQGTALWMSDRAEGPDLGRQIELLLARANAGAHADRSAVYTAVEGEDRIFLFTVDDSEGQRLGAVGIVCRDMASAANGSAKTVARLLKPLIDILRDAWAVRADATRSRPHFAAVANQDATVPQKSLPADLPDDDNAPPLAVLRRLLASVTQGLNCCFGSILASNPAFTLSHRVSLEESDLSITSATDNARGRLLESMNSDSGPAIVNDVTPGRSEFAPHKVLALPLRGQASRLAGLIVLFRSRHGRDFSPVDINALAEIVPRLEERVLAALAARSSTRDGPSIKPPRATLPALVQATPPPALEMVAETDAAISMEERVRAALDEDGFSLFAQRIYPLRNASRPPRFEVLLRLRDGDTLYAPASFFGAAQAGKLMDRLDEWVIRSLMQVLRTHANVVRLSGWEFCVNVARQSLTSPRFADFVVAEICKSSIPPGLLVFELIEDDALGDRGNVESLATRLRDVGCRIALDNCRAGLGTFGSLRDWPVSCLKIDGSVIREVSTNAQARSVVRALAELAAHRGIETVAECVETEETRTTLCNIGLDFAQGFHLEVPQPLESLFR